jgi:hypothetical protein
MSKLLPPPIPVYVSTRSTARAVIWLPGDGIPQPYKAPNVPCDQTILIRDLLKNKHGVECRHPRNKSKIWSSMVYVTFHGWPPLRSLRIPPRNAAQICLSSSTIQSGSRQTVSKSPNRRWKVSKDTDFSIIPN